MSGENINNWTTLIGIRLYKDAKELKEVLPPYLASIKKFLVVKPQFFKNGTDKNIKDMTLFLILSPPDRSYYEYDLHRFITTSEGVQAYQYAIRIPAKSHPDNKMFDKLLNQLMPELNKLNVVVHDSVPVENKNGESHE